MAMEKPVIPTEEQLEILEYHFCKVNKHPDPTTLCLIAAETGLSEEQTLQLVNTGHICPRHLCRCLEILPDSYLFPLIQCTPRDLEMEVMLGIKRIKTGVRANVLYPSCFLKQKWFKQRLAEWRKSEGLPSESGSVRD